MAFVFNWTEHADPSLSATTRNGQSYRVEQDDAGWWALTPYGNRIGPFASIPAAKSEAEGQAIDLEGYENVF